MTLTIDCLS